MSDLPSKPHEFSSIGNIKTVEDVKQWLRTYGNDFDKWYTKLRNQLNNGGLSTNNWDIRESTTADVTAGDAQAAGNLIVIHKTNGTRHEFET